MQEEKALITKALGISSLRRPVNKSFQSAISNSGRLSKHFPISLAASTPKVFPSSSKYFRFLQALISFTTSETENADRS